jgi:hypothetical protein
VTSTFVVLCVAVVTLCLVAVIRDRHMLPPHLRVPLLSAMTALWLTAWTIAGVWVTSR